MYGQEATKLNHCQGLTGGPECAAAQPEAAYAAERLESRLMQLDMVIGDLEAKLKPVLMQMPSDPQKLSEVERGVSSPLASGLMGTSYRVDGLKDRIVALLNALAI